MIGDLDFLFVQLGDAPSRPYNTTNVHEMYKMKWYKIKYSVTIPLLCVQWRTPDDGQMNCPKYVEFLLQNKFENLVYLVGFILRIYHVEWSPELQRS